MQNKLTDLGPSEKRTVINKEARRVNVTRKVLSAALNLVATDIRGLLPVFGSIIEEAICNNHRVICFHDDPVLYGISSTPNFDILQVGGNISGGRLRESDAGHMATYAFLNSKQDIFINLGAMESGEPARFVAEFLRVYSNLLESKSEYDPAEYELFCYYGMQRIFTRTRDRIGDTIPVHITMRFQALASTRNIGILNAANSLSEQPREFLFNTPTAAFGRITLPKHVRELKSHVTDEHYKRIDLAKDDKDCGIMRVKDGYLSYFPGSDLPKTIGEGPPYMLEPTQLLSDIGGDWDGYDPKNNRHLSSFGTYLKEARKKAADQKAAAELEELMEAERKRAKRRRAKKLVDSEMRKEAHRTISAPVLVAERTPTLPQRRVANDNANESKSNAREGTKRFNGRGHAVSLLKEIGIASPGLLVTTATRVLSVKRGTFNVPLDPRLTAQKLATCIAEDELLREAIHAGNSFATRYSNNAEITVSGPAVAAAYYEMLNENLALARSFLKGMLGVGRGSQQCAEGAELEKTIANLGREDDGDLRAESQFQTLRSSWIGYRFRFQGTARRVA